MGPAFMAIMLFGLSALFAATAGKRLRLMLVGRPTFLFDRIKDRIWTTIEFAFLQKRMPNYKWAGWAHRFIFGGFLILLFRTLILWGRGFDPTFNLFILGPGTFLGHAYEFIKDVTMFLVIGGSAVFLYLRVIKQEARMTKSAEAVLILVIILTMMSTDMAYDGAALALHQKHVMDVCAPDADVGLCDSVTTIVAHLGAKPLQASAVSFDPWLPGGSAFGVLLQDLPPLALVVIAHIGFWTHASLVMIFLNLLPLSKHFHVITAIPNVFLRDLDGPGRLAYAGGTETLMEKVEAAFEAAEEDKPAEQPVGIGRVDDFTWKAILDFYTCTECGRCSDHCPAHRTGKILSPKQLTIDLRDHFYERQEELIANDGSAPPTPAEEEDDDAEEPFQLIGDVIHPDVLWACTTCRACEEQCPVMISYVDKIVDMRRNLVLIKGEMPPELQGPFDGMETNGNPWNMSRMDRGAWSDGLDIPTMADKPDAEVLYWVGCAASYDDRAKKIARSVARLLQAADVDFALLGEEESCTGDPARRAGNEFLFATLAEANAEVLNGYKEQGGVKKIITACPHCFNTLANEYPDFGARFEVVHHSVYLDELVATGKLQPKESVEEKVVFHDSCYLGRYNEVYEQPRNVLRAIPGLQLLEAEGANRKKGLCCGAGGMQMFMEEQNKDRMSVRRSLQLVDTGAQTIASSCPFCTTMLTDGLKAQNKEDEIKQLDIAELLAVACGLEEKRPTELEVAAE
ncbi:MAG: (Fe-S)-binding protein [Myxococcota bacterium]